MRLKLYVVPGSHPCLAVEAALKLKGLAYERIDLLPLVHKPVQYLLFGKPTVPALRIDNDKVIGSRAIMRILDSLAPNPPLLPTDLKEREAVETAEAWGEEILQPFVRRISWGVLARKPEVMRSYGLQARFPVSLDLAMHLAKPIAWAQQHIRGGSDAQVRADIKTLPDQLDHIDQLIAEQVIGHTQPNAADLQIGSSLALIMSFGDFRPLIASRPCGKLVQDHFADLVGEAPAGILPADWLPPASPRDQ